MAFKTEEMTRWPTSLDRTKCVLIGMNQFAEIVSRKFRSMPFGVTALPDDREVKFQAPDRPGSDTLSLPIFRMVPVAEGLKADETSSGGRSLDALPCLKSSSAFNATTKFATELPANPSGTIPSSVVVETRESCPVFTPEEGGSLEMNGYSVTALPGAIHNDEFIAICMRNAGKASNAGMTDQRYTLHGRQARNHGIRLGWQEVAGLSFKYVR